MSWESEGLYQGEARHGTIGGEEQDDVVVLRRTSRRRSEKGVLTDALARRACSILYALRCGSIWYGYTKNPREKVRSGCP